MPRLHLVRHGQASLLGDDYDRLSPLGLEQSRQLGRWMAARGESVEHAWSGTLRRQRESAGACLDALPDSSANLRIDARFDEYTHEDVFRHHPDPQVSDWAALSARLRACANPRREFQALFSTAFECWVAGGRSGVQGLRWSQFGERCVQALHDVAGRCTSGEAALVFTSGGVISAIGQHLLGVPDSRVRELHYALHNASVTRLLSRPGRISLAAFNTIAHLEVPGLDPALVTFR